MLRVNPSYQNISNYFVETQDVSTGLSRIIKEVTDSLFGVEIVMSSGVTTKFLITPPHVRLGEDASSFRESSVSGFTFYEGYLSRPHFLPLYGANKGQFLSDLEDIALYNGERLCIQLLFKKKFHWKEKALDMYASYLEGNDYPASFRIGRFIQEKTLSVLNRVASFESVNEYVPEVEEKLLSDGFQFQMRVAMQSEREDYLKSRVTQVLRTYDSHNSIRLYKQKHKQTETQYETCIMTSETGDQIISTKELFSLLGSQNVVAPQTVPVSLSTPTVTKEIIKLLPEHHREEVHADESLVMNIAEALKRVGLIKMARVYNESVTAGIRLTVVQCDIPKGKNLSHIVQKGKDIQAALGVPSLGVEQGDTADTVKFVIPNNQPAIISLRELIGTANFQEYSKNNELAFAVGVDEVNNPIYLSLAKLVHLMVAGTTGSGKSVFLNSMITTLLVSYPPDRLRMTLIDPKQVELQQYKGFPHVDAVVTDMGGAAQVLEDLVIEMEKRYKTFKDNDVKNITLYNQKSSTPMPYTVCVIDEYADLVDTNKEVEEYIARLGQKARAAGIHLVIATQRPSSNILSGRIKANIPNAISFNLNNNNNYRTVFGAGIGYKLLGRGDGVMKIEGYPKEFQRFQSAIIAPDEAEEEKVYKALIDYYGGAEVPPETAEVPEQPEQEPEVEDDHLYRLKQVIATTEETRVEPLRKALGVKTAKMKELMGKLVEEGWLVKHKERSKGYELVCPESILSEWRE
ncbi:putative FtsK/SpoIIIE protein [Bacillus phage BSP36]|nr:putative FtsK/SpoIIIE protein [Bacillus phage BSP36]